MERIEESHKLISMVDLLNKLKTKKQERMENNKSVIFRHEDIQIMNRILEHMKWYDSIIIVELEIV